MERTRLDKVRENRLRRAAKRQGVMLVKSRRRDPRAIDYGRYWVVDPGTGGQVSDGAEVGLSLDDVEAALTEGRW